MEINLYNRQKEVIGTVVFDDEDKELVMKYPWSMTKAGYAYSPRSKKDNGCWYMHRLIMDAPEGFVVNHINHNKLDNRKENLEIVSHKVNIRKMKKQSGIAWDKTRNKWRVHITTDYKTRFVGRFNTYEEALNARKQAEKDDWNELCTSARP